MGRSIGITCKECVRLIKSMKLVISYHRAGEITIIDIDKLALIN
jgi:hypothetical protein